MKPFTINGLTFNPSKPQGKNNLEKCPVQPHIPLFLLVWGSSKLLLNFMILNSILVTGCVVASSFSAMLVTNRGRVNFRNICNNQNNRNNLGQCVHARFRIVPIFPIVPNVPKAYSTTNRLVCIFKFIQLSWNLGKTRVRVTCTR